MDPLAAYREIWLVDFEFHQPDGEQPQPLCMVAREHRTGRTLRLSADELAAEFLPPFSTGEDSLFVAYFASAELSCFLSLGWQAPSRVLDLFCEFRNLTNGIGSPCGNGLLGALAYFGLPGIDGADKGEMRDLAIRGGSFTSSEQAALLDYCETDVVALAKLLPAMMPQIDLPRALLRGRYMAAVAAMERNGIPVDTADLLELRQNWDAIKGKLTREIDRDYRVFVPAGEHRINPSTRLGVAIAERSRSSGINEFYLAEAVDQVWKWREDKLRDTIAAEQAARKATGLTTRRLWQWEDDGKDHSTWQHLDTMARELAAEYPELGLGTGYGANDGIDHAAGLWNRLRKETERLGSKHDEAILEEACRLAADTPDEIPLEVPLGFSAARFAGWLIAAGIPWPRLDSGALALDDDTFRQMARAYPQVAPLRELRHSLGEMRLFSDLTIGSDGRNRCLLSPFRSITSRNQPSNAKFVFGPSCWLRGLIRPAPGRAIAYVDWSQQEFGIAAALSGDAAMRDAYLSADPYLTFAKQAGAVPATATKASHKAEREQFKVCALAVQYGMGEHSLAQSLGKPPIYARELLRLHRETYPRFWKWSEAAVNHAMLLGWLQTVFGWRVQVGAKANPRSLANFPMQANGAEMMRLACCLATERGIAVCAPIHDALLVEGEADEIETVAAATQAVMAEASRVVLAGFELRSDAKIVRHPERYSDPRGERMWQTVQNILAGLPRAEVVEVEEGKYVF